MSNYTTHFNDVLSRPEFLPLPLPQIQRWPPRWPPPQTAAVRNAPGYAPLPARFSLGPCLDLSVCRLFLVQGCKLRGPCNGDWRKALSTAH